jgi:glycosyltransferase involved in cell wall biosynthesis
MRVLQYYNWGYFEPITCGADVTASNQLDYFRRNGWEVDVLLHERAARAHQAAAFHARYPWLRSIDVATTAELEFSFRGQLFAHEQIAQSAAFQNLAGRDYDLFLTNYVFSAPLAVRMKRSCKKVLEAHDIITTSFSMAERKRRTQNEAMACAGDAFCWRLELELYKIFDKVLFVNEEESRMVERLDPGRTAAVPPMMPWERMSEPALASDGCQERTEGHPYDLIFVGSDAQANVDGLHFFYYRIFVPYLRKRKVKLAAVGKVCDRLAFHDSYVTKLGTVAGDLRGCYERSKLVIIPILEGSGLSIKTIECLASGRAVVTSPLGARGLRPDSESFLEIDMVSDPSGTAQAILDLLESQPSRARMQRKAREYYQANFGSELYLSAMDSVMDSLGLPSKTMQIKEGMQ